MFHIADPEGLIFIISGVAFLLSSIAIVHAMPSKPEQ
jgi:hypothetical protein